jgi:hypothetical protein
MTQHRGRLEIQYTDAGTCYKDRVTGKYIQVRKLYGNQAWDVSALETTFTGQIASTRFNHAPRRQELTEWLDEVLRG